MKKLRRIAALLLAVALCMGIGPVGASAASRFPDAKGWSRPYVNELADLDILHGYPDGTVRPNQNITQAEYAILLTFKAGIKPVPIEGSWDAKYSGALSRAGVIAAEEIYDPSAGITRMEIIAWTIRAMGGEKPAQREQKTISFPDSAQRTPEERGYLAVSSDSGLIVGFPDGNAHPDDLCTRGEAFAILCRYDAAKSYVEQVLASEPVYNSPIRQPDPPKPIVPKEEPITLTAPEKVTATDPWEVSVTLRSDVTEATWQMPDASYEGALTDHGGTLTFSQAGEYTLTLSGKDAKGDPVSKSVTVTVEELPPVRIIAPTTATVNQPWTATVQATHNIWDSSMIVECEGGDGGYDGWLGNDGGTLTFFVEGTYTVTLSGRDDNGESISGSITVEVQPEPVSLTVTGSGESATTGGDYDVTVAVTGNLWELNWTLTRDGETVWDGYGGQLSTWNGSNSIYFTEPGTWVLTLQGQSVEGAISDSLTVEVTGNPIRQIASPSFTIPQQVYVDTDCSITLDQAPAEGVTVSWVVQPESYTGELSSSGGTLRFSTSGEYTMTATACDASGNKSVSFQTITVKERPEIRMEPFRWRSELEYETSMRILHVDDVFTDTPESINADDMTSVFTLLTADGEPAEAQAASFTDRNGRSYNFVPKVEGDYLVKATLTDATGTSFEFFAKFKVVPNVYAEITGIPRAALVGQELTGEVIPHNMTQEQIEWKLSYLSDEIAAQEILIYGEKGLADCARGWEFKSLEDDAVFDLTETGFTVSFPKTGYYAIMTNVTDQYNKTRSCYAMVHIVAES